MSKTLILFDFSEITITSLGSGPLQGISFATHWSNGRNMEVNNTELKKSSWQASYILVALVLVLFSYGCAIFRGLSESKFKLWRARRVVIYEQPTGPVVSDSPTLVKSENSRPVNWSKKLSVKRRLVKSKPGSKPPVLIRGPLTAYWDLKQGR